MYELNERISPVKRKMEKATKGGERKREFTGGCIKGEVKLGL